MGRRRYHIVTHRNFDEVALRPMVSPKGSKPPTNGLSATCYGPRTASPQSVAKDPHRAGDIEIARRNCALRPPPPAESLTQPEEPARWCSAWHWPWPPPAPRSCP